VSLAGITSNDKPIIDLDVSGISAADMESNLNEWSKIYRGVTNTNEIVFYAYQVPLINLPILVKVVK
jgi:hypothetical protein